MKGKGVMIDIHAHILPGLDDGARDMEDSLAMAELALESGVHTIVATSHANTEGFFKEYVIPVYLERLEEFRRALKREKMPLTVLPGMEIFTNDEASDKIREGKLISLNGSPYYLMEFPFGIYWEDMDELLCQVADLGAVPVIAHPERYRCVQEDIRAVISWREQGYLIQVNRGSIFGRFGTRAKECVDKLLSQKLVTCIASDAHKPYERTTYMADIKEYMEERYSFHYSRELLYENPLKILEGRRINES